MKAWILFKNISFPASHVETFAKEDRVKRCLLPHDQNKSEA